jgi:hypothetical protein
VSEQTKPKKPTEDQVRESRRAAAAALMAPNSFEVNAKAEHARNPVPDFFDDAALRAKMNHSPHAQDRKAARAELVARRTKAHATAARNSDTARRNAPHHVKLANVEARLRLLSTEELEAIEGTAWYRNLAPYGQALVDEALEKIQLEEYQSDPVMAEARLERYGAEQEPAFRFESADPEAQLALETWLDDDSGFVEEPGDERSLGQVFDDEYDDALARYGGEVA